MNGKIILFLLQLSFIFVFCSDESNKELKRNLEGFLNYDCYETECQKLNIFYVKSSKFKNSKKVGPDYHFVSSTYGGRPAFFVLSTKNDSEIQFNYTKLIKNDVDAISFQNHEKQDSPINIFGLLIESVFFYTVDKDNEDFDITKAKPIPTDLKWDDIKILKNTSDNIHLEFNLKDAINKGNLNIRTMITSASQNYEENPHLIQTPKSIHLQLKTDGFEMFNVSSVRFGLNLIIVSKTEKFERKVTKTFNDELSPGIFNNIKYIFGEKISDLSFLSFKPNAYQTKDNTLAQAIDCTERSFNKLNSTEVFKLNNAFNGFFGNKNNFNSWTLPLTFGVKGQSFYTKNNYTQFSFVFGLNDLDENNLSLFIKLIIIIGSGLSLIVLLVFPISICLMTRKMKQRRNSALLNQDNIY